MRLRLMGSLCRGTDRLWVWLDVPAARRLRPVLEELLLGLRGNDYLRENTLSSVYIFERPIPEEDQLVPIPRQGPRQLDLGQDLIEQGVMEGDTLLLICIPRQPVSAALWHGEALISSRFASEPTAVRATCPLAQDARVDSILKQKELRIFMARAQGNGHQGCSLQLMKSLRRLGFRGTFDVVYDQEEIEEDKGNRIGKKLAELLPGYVFNPLDNDIQEVDAFGLKVRVTSLKHFQAVGAPAMYGFTGALDNVREHADILDKLKVTFFTQLQPLNWTPDSGVRKITYWHEDRVKLHDLSKLYPLGYIYEDPVLSDAEATFAKLLAAARQEKKIAPLRVFHQACARKDLIHTLMGYGFGTSMNAGDVPCSLFNLALGVLFLQDQDPKHRPVLIGIAGWSDATEVARLNKALACELEGGLEPLFARHSDTLMGDLSTLQAHFKTRLLMKGERPRVQVIDIEAEGAEARMGTLQPGEVLIVALGRVVEPVYNHLVRLTSLPNCFESVNGMDRERQNKPYLHVAKEVSNQFPGSDLLDGAPNKETDQLAEHCMTLGRLFQGAGSLALWARNYCPPLPGLVFRFISELPPKEQAGLGFKTKDGKPLTRFQVTSVSPPQLTCYAGKVKSTVTGAKPVSQLLDANKDAFLALMTRLRQEDPGFLIGQFMLDTLEAGSAVSRYFAKLKTYSTTRDQVRLALEELAKLPGA